MRSPRMLQVVGHRQRAVTRAAESLREAAAEVSGSPQVKWRALSDGL